MTYQVKDWGKRFENNRTRELKEMNWFPVTNRFDGDGYTELVEGHKNGPAHYAAFVAMCGVASRCDPRGTLLRDAARPHDSVSLARKTRLPQALFEEAIPRLIAIGWLVQKDNVNPCQQTIPQEGAIKSQEGAAKSHPIAMEGNGREGKEGNDFAAPPRGANSAPPTKPPRPRNELFDAIATAFNLTPSSSDGSLIGKVAASLKAKGAKPEDIARRMKNYRAHFPDCVCTATALDKHWALCASPPAKANGDFWHDRKLSDEEAIRVLGGEP